MSTAQDRLESMDFLKKLFHGKKSGTTKHTAVIFVDVDGTISPSQFPYDDADYFHSDWNGGHYFPNQLRIELQELPGQKVWLTGWGSDAEDTFQCGWPALESEFNGGLWKLELAKDYFKNNPHVTKAVWFDDEMDQWSHRITEIEGVEVLEIHTDPKAGLTPQDLEEARKFLKLSEN